MFLKVFGGCFVKTKHHSLLALSNLMCFWTIFGFLLRNPRLSLDIFGSLRGSSVVFGNLLK